MPATSIRPVPGQPTLSILTVRDLPALGRRAGFDDDQITAMRAVAEILPFRVNDYVADELIDWSSAPDDPIFRMVFPQPDMLPAEDVERVAGLLRGAGRAEVAAAVREVRGRLNPHPAGQLRLNIPTFRDEPLPGVQHKYRQTVLFFPRQGQTCHAYCAYCFRWAQFIGEPDLKIAGSDIDALVGYVRAHPDVTNVLFSGGDPMIMRTDVLARYLTPLLELEQLESIRIGSKALAYWPYRFVTDPDADDLLRLFERVVAAGKDLSFMAHVSHPRELEPAIVDTAVRRIRGTGAVMRTQAPLLRRVNDSASVWSRMWRQQVRLGMVPYYMFVERDTGPQDYFKVSLDRAARIFRDAYADVSGLARTVRGPSMSTESGKVCVDGVAEIAGTPVFVLHYLQARDESLVNRPFFAAYDPSAAWFTELEPALADRFPGTERDEVWA